MKKLCIYVLFFVQGFVSAQVLDSTWVYTQEDIDIFNDYVFKFREKRDLPMNDLLLETGFYFLETPYVNYTLEVAQPEKLIINLRELDCTTFTETCLALARTIKSNCDVSFETYACELKKIRYRYGNLIDYTSRLHYFSDWIFDNNEMGIVKDVTKENGGVSFPIMLNTMTRFSKNYPQLANQEYLDKISALEKSFSNRNFYYISKNNIDSIQIKEGDILAMTVSGKGMDIMHMGIAVRIFNKVYFMHASSKFKKVMITEVPFQEYLAAIKSNTGYMIARPMELEE